MSLPEGKWPKAGSISPRWSAEILTPLIDSLNQEITPGPGSDEQWLGLSMILPHSINLKSGRKPSGPEVWIPSPCPGMSSTLATSLSIWLEIKRQRQLRQRRFR
jgi:hypothetical protein